MNTLSEKRLLIPSKQFPVRVDRRTPIDALLKTCFIEAEFPWSPESGTSSDVLAIEELVPTCDRPENITLQYALWDDDWILLTVDQMERLIHLSGYRLADPRELVAFAQQHCSERDLPRFHGLPEIMCNGWVWGLRAGLRVTDRSVNHSFEAVILELTDKLGIPMVSFIANRDYKVMHAVLVARR